MALVVDASIALAWALPDESSAYADAVLVVVERHGLRVPNLWPREIANGLAVAHRRGRITTADERAVLAALSHLHIEREETAPRPGDHSRGDGRRNALRPHGLRRRLCRSCSARKTNACHARRINAPGRRAIGRCYISDHVSRPRLMNWNNPPIGRALHKMLFGTGSIRVRHEAPFRCDPSVSAL